MSEFVIYNDGTFNTSYIQGTGSGGTISFDSDYFTFTGSGSSGSESYSEIIFDIDLSQYDTLQVEYEVFGSVSEGDFRNEIGASSYSTKGFAFSDIQIDFITDSGNYDVTYDLSNYDLSTYKNLRLFSYVPGNNFRVYKISVATQPTPQIVKGRKSWLTFDGNDDYAELDNQSIRFIEFEIEHSTVDTSGFWISKQVGSFDWTSIFLGYSQTNNNYYLGDYTRKSTGTYSYYQEDTSLTNANGVLVRYDIDTREYFFNGVSQGTVNTNVVSGSNVDFNDVNDPKIALGVRQGFGGTSFDFRPGNYKYLAFRDSSNNLLLEYNFNEGTGTTLTDSVGNNDGTIVGATWQSEENAIQNIYYGSPSYSLSFDGVDDYITLSNFDTSGLSYDSWTWYVEILNYQQQSGRQMLISADGYESSNTSNSNGYFIAITDNQLEIFYIVNNTNYFETVNFTLNNNNDYNILVSRNHVNGDLNVNINNNNFNISGQAGTIQDGGAYSSNTLDIGAVTIPQWGDYRVEFTGNIAYLKAYNSVKTISQMGDTPFLEYLIDEGSGNTLTDSVGTNDGTIVGATWSEPLHVVPRIYLGETLVYGEPRTLGIEFDTGDYALFDYPIFDNSQDWELEISFNQLGTYAWWFSQRSSVGNDWTLFNQGNWNDQLAIGLNTTNGFFETKFYFTPNVYPELIKLVHDVSEKTIDVYLDGVFNDTLTYTGDINNTATETWISRTYFADYTNRWDLNYLKVNGKVFEVDTQNDLFIDTFNNDTGQIFGSPNYIEE